MKNRIPLVIGFSTVNYSASVRKASPRSASQSLDTSSCWRCHPSASRSRCRFDGNHNQQGQDADLMGTTTSEVACSEVACYGQRVDSRFFLVSLSVRWVSEGLRLGCPYGLNCSFYQSIYLANG